MSSLASVEILLIYGLTCAVFAFFGMYTASEKGRSAIAWFILCGLFTVPALISLAGIPAISQQQHSFAKGSGAPWKCPNCGKAQPVWSRECSCGYKQTA
jgi:hypothetical protein